MTHEITSEGRLTLTVEAACPICLSKQTVQVSKTRYHRWRAGESTQTAFANLTPGQREILLSGICEDCWEGIR